MASEVKRVQPADQNSNLNYGKDAKKRIVRAEEHFLK